MSERLDYLRSQIEAETISYGEIQELQNLAAEGLIPEGDVVLLEWAEVPEFPATRQFKLTTQWPSNVFDSGTASRTEWMDEEGLIEFFQAIAGATNVIAIGETFLIERVEDANEGDQT